MAVKHVEETCTECGKTITTRAVAHVYHNLRVVCSACLRKLQAKDQREEEAKSAAQVTSEMLVDQDSNEPTIKQIRFAEHLGIASPGSYGKWELSDKITEALAERDDRAANARFESPNKRKSGSTGCLVILAFGVVMILAFTKFGLM